MPRKEILFDDLMGIMSPPIVEITVPIAEKNLKLMTTIKEIIERSDEAGPGLVLTTVGLSITLGSV